MKMNEICRKNMRKERKKLIESMKQKDKREKLYNVHGNWKNKSKSTKRIKE